MINNKSQINMTHKNNKNMNNKDLSHFYLKVKNNHVYQYQVIKILRMKINYQIQKNCIKNLPNINIILMTSIVIHKV